MWLSKCRTCGQLIGPGETDRAGYGNRHTTCEFTAEEVHAAYEEAIEAEVDRIREERHG